MYREALKPVGGIRWPGGHDLPGLSCQSLVVEVTRPGQRDRVITSLGAQGIATTIGGYGLASQPFWVQRDELDPTAYPVASRLADGSLTLPVTHEMIEEDVRRVARALDQATSESP